MRHVLNGKQALQAAEEGILTAIGNTPIVRLTRAVEHLDLAVYAKLEGLNPGGSAKDRPAIGILRQAMRTGVIDRSTVVIESSSGNMGIGLAQVCAYYGLRFICVIDPRTSDQVRQLLEVYGAEIDLVIQPDAQTGDYLKARLARVQELLGSVSNSFWPNQYASPDNAGAHHQTMDEIVQTIGPVDYLFCATSTCGTLRGCADYVKERGLKTRIIAVDAVGSMIFSERRGKRLLPGHGAGICPPLFQPGLAERCVHVTDMDCVVGCRRLVRKEGILAGASSGGVLRALDKVGDELPRQATVALIFCDRGDRYLGTVYSDAWVQANLGQLLEMEEQNGKNGHERR